MKCGYFVKLAAHWQISCKPCPALPSQRYNLDGRKVSRGQAGLITTKRIEPKHHARVRGAELGCGGQSGSGDRRLGGGDRGAVVRVLLVVDGVMLGAGGDGEGDGRRGVGKRVGLGVFAEDEEVSFNFWE